jgi:predicted secreted protein
MVESFHNRPEASDAAPVATLRAPRDSGEAREVLDQTRVRLDALDQDVAEAAVLRAVAQPAETRRVLSDRVGQQRLDLLKTATDQNRATIDAPNGGTRTRLQEKLRDRDPQDTFSARLTQIMDALVAPPPALGDAPEGEGARYLEMRRTRRTENREDVAYHTKPFRIAEDRQFLLRVKTSVPDAAAEIDELLACLQRMSDTDPERAAAYEVWQGRDRGSMSQGAAKMGRLAAVVALAAVALIMGAIAAANRKFSLTPFIYGAAALWAANPSMFKGLFSRKEEKLLREAAGVVGSRRFNRQLCPDNGIEGPRWGQAVNDMIEQRDKTRRAADDVARGRLDSEAVEDFLAGMPEEDGVRAKLRQMMGKDAFEDDRRPVPSKEFVVFARILLRVRSQDAREFVADYVRRGAWRVAGTMPAGGPPQNPPAN